MEYTSINIYGHFLSDDILHEIETDTNLIGNRDRDFGFDASINRQIDYAWSSLRSDWTIFNERKLLRDTYGTTSVRKLMSRFFQSIDYNLDYQTTQLERNGNTFDIPYICHELGDLPIIIVGDLTGESDIETLDKCTLDYRAKGTIRRKSPHATMLDYLNNTDNVYGIVTNGQILRIIRNTGQLVKKTYIEFDLHRMIEEDHYSEFCVLFRLLHASRFSHSGDDSCIIEQWFNMSIESGNRIRAGLSNAVQQTMEVLGRAVVCGKGKGNEAFRQAFTDKQVTAETLNKELIHFIYRLLFLFIIEDRDLIYQLPQSADHPDYKHLYRCHDIYKKYYAVSRLRRLSELNYLKNNRYHDLWESLMDTFRLFEDESFGAPLGIKPLGGVLFDADTLHYLKQCTIANSAVLDAFGYLNEFIAEGGQRVKINYSSLDVEEFGSVYEGILEMRAVVIPNVANSSWNFKFGYGLDRQSTSSYYTRPDLVQSLIKTTLEPVIQERIAKCQTNDEKIKSLLSMKVCDAASGSGHIVLAMARTIAWYVSTLRTEEDNPASLDYREALREVIQKCIFAVDYNPDAVELCKVVLWIEGYCAGKPLSFLDHHIRCGNSVVGIANLDMLFNGVPNDAFTAKDNEVKKKIKKLNTDALKDLALVKDGHKAGLEVTLFSDEFVLKNIESEQVDLAADAKSISIMPEDSLPEEIAKQKRWELLMQSPRVECLRNACDIYSYAFYKQFTDNELNSEVKDDGTTFSIPSIPYTRTVYHALEEIKHLDNADSKFVPLSQDFKNEVEEVAAKQRFFHWCIEFPEVFAQQGGFDVMCGNPPWDKIKVEDKKWFETNGRTDIVNAGTAAQRKKAIENLKTTDPILHNEYIQAQQDAEGLSRFVRFSGRFSLTATGDIDLYPMFGELCLSFSKEAWGLVMPTGIAVNDSNKAFFSKLIDDNRLISLYDFENKEKLFDIHRMFKFCLLTAGKAQTQSRIVRGGFYLTRLDHLLDPNRIYTLRTDDFTLLNPNTKTCPTFRTSRDAKLTSKIYHNSEVLINESTGENPWDVHFGRMIDMSNDSHLFRTYAQLIEAGATIEGNKFTLDNQLYVPLYEGKMIWHYNHHYGTWPTDGERPNTIPTPSATDCGNPNSYIIPWYWVPQSAVDDKLIKYDKDGNVVWEWKHKWLFGFRAITNATNERTFIVAPIPDAVGVGHSATLLYEERGTMPGALLLGMMSSLPFDYTTRQKIGGSNASISFVKQFPVLTPEQISDVARLKIIPRVAELCYFNHDLDGWMEELWHDEEMTDEIRNLIAERLKGCNGIQFTEIDFNNIEPFIYNEDRRATAQAELDAIFAHLYGLTTEELRYILDPEDVCGVGCINETFRVLKDNETRKYGEYRTKRLVLEAWNKMGFNN